MIFSTYPTMMNAIDERKNKYGERLFSPGHFQLIICDEVHRSIYKKYQEIFEYFDAMLLGMTATPKNEIDKNTYGVFDLERGVPTFAYELEKAVEEGYLVNYSTLEYKSKIMESGIHYDELSDEENEQLTVEFTQHLADELGVIGDYCIHKPTIDNYPPKADYIESYDLDTKQSELTRVNDVKATEPDKRNIHAHIMFTTRKAELTANGKLLFGEKADSDRSELWRQSKKMVNGGDYIKQVRELWADMVNKRLAQHEIALISHKSYKDLGLDIQPQHKKGKSSSVLSLYSDTSISRVIRFNNGYKERNRDAIESATDSCTTLSKEARDRAIGAGNEASAGADRSAAAAREADNWLSTATPTPFDRKRGAEKLDEQTRIFDRLAEREDKITVRRHGELIEQAIQNYWDAQEWKPYIQKSDWSGGGMETNPKPDPSDTFNPRQMNVIKNISEHLEGVDNDSHVNKNVLRGSLGQHGNERILTLLTNPTKEQFQYEQDKKNSTEIVASNPSLDNTQEEESVVDHEESKLAPLTPRNTYRPSL